MQSTTSTPRLWVWLTLSRKWAD